MTLLLRLTSPKTPAFHSAFSFLWTWRTEDSSYQTLAELLKDNDRYIRAMMIEFMEDISQALGVDGFGR